MYFSKDANSVPPTFESPWIHRGWTPAGTGMKTDLFQSCGHY